MSDSDKQLYLLVQKAKIIINELLIFSREMLNDDRFKILVQYTVSFVEKCQENLEKREIDYSEMREFLNTHYYKMMNIVNTLVVGIKTASNANLRSVENWAKKDKTTLLMANYILMNQNYRRLKELINEHFIKSYKSSYELVVDENSPLWDTSEAEYKEFPSNLFQVREIAKEIIRDIPHSNGDFSMTILEEQVSEIIKNAVKHGNKNDSNKNIRVWYYIDKKLFKIIVGNEGEGFTNFDHWNEFNKKRNAAIKNGNMEEMMQYIQYKGPNSREDDGGNSLFSALEF